MIHWYINEQQADYVFKCLGQRPFAEVSALIQDLYNQANPPRPSPEEVALKEQAWRYAKEQEQQKKANGPIPEPPVWVDGPAP